MNDTVQAETQRPWWGDWSQYFCPGPRRAFSAAEMARGGQQPWPRGVDRYLAISLLVVGGVLMAAAPERWPALLLLLAGMAALGGLALWATRLLWRSPTRLRLNLGIYTAWLLMVALLLGLDRIDGLDDTQRKVAAVATGVLILQATTAWWFMAIYRVQQIDTRLHELDEQDAKMALQRRLATAQIHPHFVFNTLASLTHWVDTGDARAAPLLREFNAYLRATLPMFEREQQPLREELALVRHYLAIMQARLGDRLAWSVDCSIDGELPLPPGSLLTLAENALTHGIEPSLRGGQVTLRCRRTGDGVSIEVEDSGTGLAGPVEEGLGLTNTRERLLALHPQARLRLAPAPAGGCLATLEIPA